MLASRLVSETFAPLVDLIYPPRCPLCGDGLAAQKGLCSACWGTLSIPGEPACRKCQRPLADGEFDESQSSTLTCAPCTARPPRHDGIAAGTLYNDAARKLVLSYKHGGRIALAPMLARLTSARLPVLDGDWLAVPVPLHRFRLWKRGFNQSALLAHEISKLSRTELVVDGLVRTRATPALGGLGKVARANTLRGAIAVNPKRLPKLRGANIILVDDVLTSGATTSVCVKALKQSGAKKVVIACFSRVLGEAA
ncbi:ComF family protein [Erythrobacter alti]|uniref:ComF family protein n=1 Tax=Erythrobacter alti TaxID=1896145 RepID=UPI0030F37E18